MSSYPTYEEWKHIRDDIKKGKTLGSYPTYEEWKRAYEGYKQGNVERSYPTYEEWKLLPETVASASYGVLILPMRNGNLRR